MRVFKFALPVVLFCNLNLLKSYLDHIDSLLVTAEWDLIYTTGKLHKCNYFTWEHARWLYRFRKEEFDLNRFIKFLKQNVSDCSVIAFAQFLAKFGEYLEILHPVFRQLLRFYTSRSSSKRKDY